MNNGFETILVNIVESWAIVWINRPNQLNSLNTKVYEELFEALCEIEKKDNVKVVIISGSGDKAFVAGADISEMKNMTSREARNFALLGKKVGRLIEEMEQPVIAAVNGFALGGGCELAISCDLIIATENSRFGQPEISLGLIPGNGGTQRLSRIVGMTKAKELVLLGEQIDAKCFDISF